MKPSKAHRLRIHIEDAQESSTVGLLWVMAQGQGIRKRIFKKEFYRRSAVTIKAALQEARNMADEKKNSEPEPFQFYDYIGDMITDQKRLDSGPYFDGTVPPGATVDNFEGPLDEAPKLDPNPWECCGNRTSTRTAVPFNHAARFAPGPQYSQNREDYA